MEQVKKREDQIEAIVAGIGPMLDNIGLPEPKVICHDVFISSCY
jgi:hypothetical protein